MATLKVADARSEILVRGEELNPRKTDVLEKKLSSS